MHCDAPTYGFGPHGEQSIGEMNIPLAADVLPTNDGADRDFTPDIIIGDGELIESEHWQLQCLYTPGHTSNHVCFAEPTKRRLFSGDHVMAWSSTVILQPDGNMGDYLRSLEHLLQRDDTEYWPAHGGAVNEPQRYVTHLLEHRRQREQQILAAVANGHDSVRLLVPVIYPSLSPALHGGALHSVLSTVIHLIERQQLVAAMPLSFERPLALGFS